MTQTPTAPASLPDKVRLAAADIKLAHSVFALPFAILAAFLARPGTMAAREFLLALGLIVVCMVSARTAAMLVNRLADRHFDAANARTARRAFASGQLSPAFGWSVAAGSVALFLASAGGFWFVFDNSWPVILAAPVLVWLCAYSYTKRYTALCHVWLGISLALSPLAAAIAVYPPAVGLSLPPSVLLSAPTTPAILWLAGMVACWVAGFDVIYALQDIDFDRAKRLRSVPSILGWNRSAWVSRVFHIVAFTFLVFSWVHERRFDFLFGLCVVGVGVLLITEHIVLQLSGKKGLNIAFFTLNGVISCVLGIVGVIEIVLVG